mgnify:FL=1
MIRLLRNSACLALGLLLIMPAFADDEDAGRRIEEVVVYGERVESTVSDTSISITAMDSEFLSDMGIQGPNEMMNFIPATTRTDWDVKIRGIGRNFRGLGGDAGVGTYYNGIYSGDFGIAATEGGLFDLERIEVLRGPQGTLYGRNSIGGVINYVTKKPNSDEHEAAVRLIVGQYSTHEFYGMTTGPITEDLAYRFTGVKRKRDFAVPGHAGSEGGEDINDQNFAIQFDYAINDNMSAWLRFNERRSLRVGNFGSGGNGITEEGPCIGTYPITTPEQCDPRWRVNRDTNYYAPGLRPVDQAWADKYGLVSSDNPNGVFPYVHPVGGATMYGAYNRPGVDSTDRWPYMPSQCYQNAGCASYDIGDADNPDVVAVYNFADEEFDQQATSLVLDWDISDSLSVRYLGDYRWFQYWFNRDNDFSNGHTSDLDDTVTQDAEQFSHEVRVFWNAGERWTATSGFYYFDERLDQHYSIRERAAQGRLINPALYGTPEHPTWLLDAQAVVGWVMPECKQSYRGHKLNTAGPGTGYGDYSCGSNPDGVMYDHYNDMGAMYEHRNIVQTVNKAFYTQGDLQLTDQLSVTLGFRYSKDDRWGTERRGGYSELEPGGWLPWAIATAMDGTEVDGDGNPITSDHIYALTPLAAMNVAMGTAYPSGDPDFPLTYKCDLGAKDCDRPVRLHGIPISWGSQTSGSYHQDGEWSYRVNFNFEPTPETLIYMGATTSYRAGGWNMGGPDNRADFDTTGNGVVDTRVLLEYGGEDLTAFEIGYKGTHLDGRLQLNVSIYTYDYSNYQDQVERWEDEPNDFSIGNLTLPGGGPVATPSGRGPVSVVENIPSAVNKGFEWDILFLASDNFSIGGNGSYTDSKYNAPYTFFNEADPRYPRDVFGGDLQENPCNAAPELKALYCLEVNGYELQGIPKTKMTFWGNYSWPLESGMLTWYAAWSFTGEYSTHPFNRPWDWVPERDRLDTRVTYEEETGQWEASLFVDNVLDKTYIRSADMDARRTGYGGNWPQRVVSLYPRYIGAEFTYNFNR